MFGLFCFAFVPSFTQSPASGNFNQSPSAMKTPSEARPDMKRKAARRACSNGEPTCKRAKVRG